MDKKKVKHIFVILVYRNVEDIVELLQSIEKKVKNYRVIIVNNFYDEITKSQFENIAAEYDCDFINCENRGYGAGNNAGIRLAMERYEFEYLIISNPDIIIEKFPEKILQNYKDGVIGCTIYNLKHVNQNPMVAKNNRFATKMLYTGLKKNASIPLFIGKAIHKFERIIASKTLPKSRPEKRKIYQVHGSFLIFAKSVIDQIGVPYDEKMFLFGEEGYLAYLLNKKGIPSYYCPEIEVLHKEDGSMKFRNDVNEECIKASIYFFEKYYFNIGEH